MPFGREGVSDGLGLAISGGGFRATLFHLGALTRLVELGILHRVSRISSVSGGSILTGRLAEVWADYATSPDVATFDRLVGSPIRAFCRLNIDAAAIGHGMLSPFTTAGDLLEQAYSQHLMAKRLDELPEDPIFIFDSTNLQTGRSFRFGKAYMGDWRLGLIRNPTLPVARAVAASSAFPPFFSPIILENPGTFEPQLGSDLTNIPGFVNKLYLADGGVYDNLGLESVWKRCSTVLVSDAGAPLESQREPHTDWVRQSMRALDIATDQARGLRKLALIADFEAGVRGGAYWGIETNISNYELATAMRCDPTKVAPLSMFRTRLEAFSDEEQGQLINWGYALADAGVRRHAPSLITGHSDAAWPMPDFPLD